MNPPSQYFARCLDPVHVGAGGYRLGRVDMTIVRESATGIPKIPGTSLAGALRSYAEMGRANDPSQRGFWNLRRARDASLLRCR